MTPHLEFIVGTTVGTLRAAWDVVSGAGRPTGGIMFDTWHFFRTDADFDLLATIPGSAITSVQLNDGRDGVVESISLDAMFHRLIPGEGVFELDRVIDLLDDIGAGALAGPEVLTRDYDHLALTDAVRLVSDGYDRCVEAAAAGRGG